MLTSFDSDIDVFRQNMQSTPEKPRSLGTLLAKRLFNINSDDSGFGFGLGRSKDMLRIPHEASHPSSD